MALAGLGAVLGGMAKERDIQANLALEQKKADDMMRFHQSQIMLNQKAGISADLSNQLSQMKDTALKQSLALSKFAELGNVPEAQRQSYYLKHIHPMLQKLGANNIPQAYTPDLDNTVNYAISISPQGVSALKARQDLIKQELVNRGKIEAVQAKTLSTASPYAASYQKAGGTADQSFATNVQLAANNALQIRADTKQLSGIGGQIPQEFGYLKGNQMVLTPQGQMVMKGINKLVLDMFNTMPHIGRGSNLLINIIKYSKPSNRMAYSSFKKVVGAYEVLAQRHIEYNNFVNYMHQSKITDRNKISSLWANYTTAYPLSDEKGDPAMGNVGKWETYLTKNPHLIGKTATDVSRETPRAQQAVIPAGFRMPGSAQATQAAQPLQQQPAPVNQSVASPVAGQNSMAASPYATASNPYDSLSR